MLNSLANFQTLPVGGPTVSFYTDWAQYLSPMPHIFLTLVMLFMHSVALIFYYLGTGVLEAYQAGFKLLPFVSIFFSPNDSAFQTWHLGDIVKMFFYLGFIIFGLMMLVQWIKYTATAGKKGREWPKGITITMATLIALPWMIGIMSAVGTSAVDSTMGTTNTSVLTQLWQGNSTNMQYLAKQNFDLDAYKKDKISKLESKDINGSMFHSVMSDPGYTDGLNNDQKKVFTQKIGGNKNITDLSGSSIALGKTFADEYPVMKTNWLGIMGGEIIFIIVVISAIIRLFSSIYKMAFMTGSIVYFGLRDGTQGKRVQQVLGLIEGQITGIVMMPISLIFFFAWIDFAFNLINSMALTVWPFTLLSIAILLAGAKGLATGFEMIEQWTGVRSGHNPVASMMLAGQAGRMFSGAAQSAKQNIGRGMKAISPAQRKKSREKGQKIAESANDNPMPGNQENQPSNSKAVGVASALGRTAGAIKSPGKLAKNAGRAAGSKIKKGVTDAVDNAKNYAGTVSDSYSGGKQAVDAFNNRHTPVKANLPEKELDDAKPRNAHEVLNQVPGHSGKSDQFIQNTPTSSTGSNDKTGNTTTVSSDPKQQGKMSSTNRNALLSGNSPKALQVPLPVPSTPFSTYSPHNSVAAPSNTPSSLPKRQLTGDEQRAKDKKFASDTVDRLIQEQNNKEQNNKEQNNKKQDNKKQDES
ncbi:FIG00773263: hypothetical protein [Leuconostoc gelidum subsp. gasicomitatum]|nr:FIG00773263: hypothetical protein [Leuconostoc gasicomitatum]